TRPEGVRYLGTVSDETMRALFQEATAFVFLSAYEGFGLPILESMASGTPVICSNLTSIPEVAGDAALYVVDFRVEEIAQLLLRVPTDPATRRPLTAQGGGGVRAFTGEKTASRPAEVYLRVIDEPAPASLFARRMFSNLLTGSARF